MGRPSIGQFNQCNRQGTLMKVLFDIVHPAQVHFFKNAIRLLQQQGHSVLVTAREKDIATQLLDALNIDYQCISKKGSNMAAMAVELLVRDVKLLKIARRFRPDIMVGRVGVSIGIVGKLLGIPTVIYDDMEHARLQGMIGMTFGTYLCTGLGYFRDLGKRQVKFRGSPVMSYMAPDYFTPDPEPLRKAGLDPDKGYIFLRTVSWGANHDIGREGTSPQELHEIIDRLSPFGRMIISSEEALPKSLSKYKNPVPIEYMHDLLAFAKICLVEGGTMAAESAVLGTPAICRNTYDFGYLRALDNEYGLIFRPETTGEMIDIAENLLNKLNYEQEFQDKRIKLLNESDDVVKFQLDMIDKAIREHPVK